MALSESNIKNVLLCEDIRTEDNGKAIIIGVFGPRILVQRMPANLQISVYFELHTKDIGKHNIFIKLRLDNDVKVNVDIGIEVDLLLPEFLPIKLPRIGLPVQSEGSLLVDVSFDKKIWINIITRKIETNKDFASTFSSAFAPPS